MGFNADLTLQTFCHTAAYPKPFDIKTHKELPDFFSTSTRNFNNRMGKGARVYLGSAELAAVCALLGKIPTVEEYIYRSYALVPKINALRFFALRSE